MVRKNMAKNKAPAKKSENDLQYQFVNDTG